jgi:hypothetical protein
MNPTIAPIVEGEGDIPAIRILIQRVATSEFPNAYVNIARPMRVPRSRLMQPGQLERYVGIAAQHRGAVLVLIDADDDCPKTLGPQLLTRIRAARGDLPAAVVLANREYEAWFLASGESLRGKCGLPREFATLVNPEAIRGAKERLSLHMGRKYNEPHDQPALTTHFAMQQAHQHSRSFRKCYKEIKRLLEEVQGKVAP